MDQEVVPLVEGARRLAATVPASEDEGSEGIHEFTDGTITVICRKKAVTVYIKGFDDPVLLVSSVDKLLHIEEAAREYLKDRLA